MSICESVTVAATATTTATPPASAAPIAASAAPASAWTLFARASQVHRQCATAKILSIHGGDGFLCFLRRAHRDECKPPGPTGCPIHHQIGLYYSPVRCKCILQVVFRRVEGKIPNEQFCAHLISVLSRTALFSRDCS